MSDWVGLRLDIDGAPLDERDFARLVGLRLTRALNAPATLSLRFLLDDPMSGEAVASGSDVVLVLEGTTLFAGRADRRRLRQDADGTRVDITASDPLSTLAGGRRIAVEEIASVHAFAREMAGRCGLAFDGGDSADFAIGRHLNRFPSDLEYLTRTLDRYGLACLCRDGALTLVDLTAERRTKMLPGEVLDLIEVVENGRRDASAWLGWCADDDRTVRPDRGVARPRIDTEERGPVAVPVRAAEPAARLHRAARARAEDDVRWLEADLSGLAPLWPGDTVRSPLGATAYRLNTVELSLDAADGARSRVRSCRSDLGTPAVSATTVLTGLVVNVDDPEDAGRVRVDLVGYGGVRTGWLSVVGALGKHGGGSGLAVPFSVGDTVLLVAPDGDPELGIVLGGLGRAGGAQRGLIRGGARTGQAWRARGASIEMDEAGGRLSLALDGGTTVELSDDRIRLSASRTLELDCGGEVRIRGSRIDFLEA